MPRSIVATFAMMVALVLAAPPQANARYCHPTRVYRCACKKVRVHHRVYKVCHRVRRRHRLPPLVRIPRVPLPSIPQLPPVVPPFPPPPRLPALP